MVSIECKLCPKKFSNGKALGGHMKTHFAFLPLSPKTPTGLVVVDKETTPKHDSQSKHGKRAKGLMGSGLNELGMGGDDDVAAWCLIMLSMDVWRSSDGDEIGKPVYRCDRCEKVLKSWQGLWNHMKAHFKKIKNPFDAHECPICGKRFGSGQALGGHKKSHFRASKFGNIVNDVP